MPQLPPAGPGMPMSQIDTPALVIDLDAFERNLDRMADAVAKAGVRLRPHAKTHKSPVIGLQADGAGRGRPVLPEGFGSRGDGARRRTGRARLERGRRRPQARPAGGAGASGAGDGCGRQRDRDRRDLGAAATARRRRSFECWSRSTSAASAAASRPVRRPSRWRSAIARRRRASNSPGCRPITAARSICAPSRSGARRRSATPSR